MILPVIGEIKNPVAYPWKLSFCAQGNSLSVVYAIAPKVWLHVPVVNSCFEVALAIAEALVLKY